MGEVIAAISRSILKSEVEPLIAFLLPSHAIRLVGLPLRKCHALPDSLLFAIQVFQKLLLGNKCNQAQCTDADQNLVATIVIWGVICSINLGT